MTRLTIVTTFKEILTTLEVLEEFICSDTAFTKTVKNGNLLETQQYFKSTHPYLIATGTILVHAPQMKKTYLIYSSYYI